MTKSIMLQGTASNVGKSILATAICRILKQDGYQVAPFKSWNMALNSYVTSDGGEVGRAQAVQAVAAGVDVTVMMQPILVKPKGDGKSQVIVHGKALGDFDSGRKDEGYIKRALEIIEQSLTKLQQEYEMIVIEGAGSPAEINIKEQDLANMKVAKLNQTPVILVADVDRGGALASVVGTLKLLEEDERSLVKGIVLNKFRGDYELLKPGIEILEERTAKPVVGVIPYIKDFKIPDEDSVAIKNSTNSCAELRLGVIRLPHISNFTDFDELVAEQTIELNYLAETDSLRGYDALIIPGTKNTTADLEYLKSSGLADKIIEQAKAGVEIIGICGGYQILGTKLFDPQLSEGQTKEIEGLALLALETVFNQTKLTHRAEAVIRTKRGFLANLKGQRIKGYEIHTGQTKLGGGVEPLFKIKSRSGKQVEIIDGAISTNNRVWGTYLHGIFGNDKLRREFINYLREKKGLTKLPAEEFFSSQELEKNYDRLADVVRKHLDMELIYEILQTR